jgi:outer membrane protein OmpA-like peptidoglycan-associated protein
MRSLTVLRTMLFLLAPFFSLAERTHASDSSSMSLLQLLPPSVSNYSYLHAQKPEVQTPTIRRPKVQIPHIQMPEIRIPEITIPGIRVQQNKNLTLITIAGDILFDFDQDTIRPDADAALQQISAAIAKRYPRNAMQIQGHTDSVGSDAYNRNLSERRAVAVKRWLEQRGVASSQMSTVGYGEARPVAPNTNPDGSDSPAGRQRNRRVEIVIRR